MNITSAGNLNIVQNVDFKTLQKCKYA